MFVFSRLGVIGVFAYLDVSRWQRDSTFIFFHPALAGFYEHYKTSCASYPALADFHKIVLVTV